MSRYYTSSQVADKFNRYFGVAVEAQLISRWCGRGIMPYTTRKKLMIDGKPCIGYVWNDVDLDRAYRWFSNRRWVPDAYCSESTAEKLPQDPTPEEIRDRCAAIRATWTEADYAHRSTGPAPCMPVDIRAYAFDSHSVIRRASA